MESIREPYYRYLRYFLAKDDTTATIYDKYMALTYAVRSEMMDDWIETQRRYHEGNVRRVYVLSNEYVIGRSLKQNIRNLGIEKNVAEVAKKFGFSLEDIYNKEDEYDLGNGSKGRLAACYQESMASLGIPAIGYGLRYDYAHFRQVIRNGMQYERPYDWLHKGHPWEVIRPEYTCEVQFGGECPVAGSQAQPQTWKSAEKVYAVPYDFPISGYRNNTVNSLRLWSARAAEEFAPDYLNHGDYIRACEEKSASGTLTRILFPDENVLRAIEQRLKQQLFFVSASLQDILRRYRLHNPDLRQFDRKVVIQLNGSGCALAIPELMRLLVDVEKIPWDEAWGIVQRTFTYTSHAIRKDDVESWPVYMITQIFPRHMGIMYEINQRHLDAYRMTPGSRADVVPELSLIEEGEVKRIRTAHLAILGSFCVNSVSRVQAEILKSRIYASFAALWPEKFKSITSGIAHRRWLLNANQPLADLITDLIDDGWICNAAQLKRLEKFVDDEDVLVKLATVKQEAKRRLSAHLRGELSVELDPGAIFDVQSNKIHLSKRQSLNILNILHRYLQLKAGNSPQHRRAYIFAGKASPSDRLAKQMIHLIHIVADVINKDPLARQFMQVLFIPDHSVTWSERIIPAADVSEQIAAPNFEPSGTMGMKFALNGTIAIASLAGTNAEMAEQLGPDVILTFGGPANGNTNGYKPWEAVKNDQRLGAIFKFLDELLPQVPGGQAVYPLLSTLRDADEYGVLRDFAAYTDVQSRVDELYKDTAKWRRRSLATIAGSGWFSADRAIEEYASAIWKVAPVK